MSPLRTLLVLAVHQLSVLLSGLAWLRATQALWGRSLHGAAHPVDLASAAAIVALYAAHLGLTLLAARAARSAPLGLALDRGRAAQFAAGTLSASCLFAAPWLIAWGLGAVRVVDVATRHPEVSAVQIGFWLSALALNSLVEESMCRALPLRMTRTMSLLSRVALTALWFALLHLADESFRLEAFVTRLAIGVALAVAYLETDNVWLAAGLHTGINAAMIARGGSWHQGALVAVEGSPVLRDVHAAVLMAALASSLYLARGRYRDGVVPVDARNCL